MYTEINNARITAVSKTFHLTVGNFESGTIMLNSGNGELKIFNVSDSYLEDANFWFPINEVAPWTYAPFYWFKKLVDNCFENYYSIHVFCHAGIHRSKMMAFTWLLSRGFSLSEAAYDLGDSELITDYRRDVENHFIPNDLEKFYNIMKTHPAWSLAGCLLELNKNGSRLLTNNSK